jgi:phospholipase/carboxylesterase
MADDPNRLASADGAPARRLVVLVHGYASSGVEMMPLAGEWAPLLPGTAFFAPDGGLDAEGEAGLAWAPRRSPCDGRLAGEIVAAARGLSDLCDAELRRLGLDDHALALVGFSQGALLAFHAGLRRAAAPAAVLCYGGGLVGRAALEAEIRVRPPVLLVNGTADQLAPADGLQPAVAFLEGLGVVAEGVALPGLGHEIDARAILLGGRFLASAFAYRDRQAQR